MQKAISEILKGNFDHGEGTLEFSCEKIELSIHRGERQEGSFYIHATPGRGALSAGSISSSDWRMECRTAVFSGTEEEIFFCFHGENLEEGEVVKGCFEVVSSLGEGYLPFVVTVEHTIPESSIGNIKNLFHFANLAKSSWKEAVKIFYSPEFGRIFQDGEGQHALDYRALSANEGLEQNMEEFLIQVNKKQHVEYVLETVQLDLEADGGEVTEEKILLLRNGWGYTQLSVQCRGEFLFTEKACLTDDDFLGNRCVLPVFVDGSLCHRGKNYGQVCLSNCYVTLTVPVTVLRSGGFADIVLDRERKSCIYHLMESYEAFRLRRWGTAQWLKETGRLVERMVAMDDEDLAARLFQAQLLITEERDSEAGWILDRAAEELGQRGIQDELLAYYYYLTTLLHGSGEYIGRMTSRVEEIYREDPSSWRVAWLLLYLSEDLQKSERVKWDFLEKMFREGCTSPVLYIEALVLLNASPVLLHRLGKFERQVVYFGIRKGALKGEVADQFVFLAGKAKEYSEVLFRILRLMYKKKKDVGLLQEICTLLIKGGKTGRAYFEWYRTGVEAQLRITKLYEYYMLSLDIEKEQEIPRTVLMYFSYENNLDYARSAYLYDYVLQKWDKPGDIYEAYRPRMESFVAEQIRRGRINRHLASLYERLLQPGMIDEQTAGPLSRLLFSHMIQVEDERIRKVYVYQPGMGEPSEYLLSEGRAWVPIYGSRYTVVLEDGSRNRFIKSAACTVRKLMTPGRFLRWVLPLAVDNPALDIYMCRGEESVSEEPVISLRRELRTADSALTAPELKRELYLRILQYYYDVDDMRSLDGYLRHIPAGELVSRERSDVVRLLVLRGAYDLAGEWLESYGPYFVEPKILVRLVGRLMEQRNMTESRLLTAAAVHVFRKGKYDSTILEYLVMHYRGLTRNMRDIWKAARAFDLDCFRLSERILVQMLGTGAFVGEKMDIFHYYISQGAKQEVEEAFLAQCSYDYFVGERVMETGVFREIWHMYQREEPVQRVCRLAYLKHAAENPGEVEREAGVMVEAFLREMLEEGIYLDFFRSFKEYRFLQQELSDKTILEYRTHPKARACIHYTLVQEDEESDDYRAEYMKEAYGGVFFKEFVLFFGETVQYYITEEKDGEEQLTESGTLQRSDETGDEEESRYRLINDIVVSRALQDRDTMDRLLEEYYRKDFIGGKLFSLK